MFTGIIEGMGKVQSLQEKGEGMVIEIAVDFPQEPLSVGESIAVNGCCLTVSSGLGNRFWAFLSPETLSLTTLADLKPGSLVNLERPLKKGSRVGGHFVQGHIDGVGFVKGIEEEKESKRVTIRAPAHLSRYLLSKGSIAVDGVSLTINHCDGNHFSVTIIPHTGNSTTFQVLRVGCLVNLEIDIVGKYVERLTHLDSQEFKAGTEIAKEFLKKHGF